MEKEGGAPGLSPLPSVDGPAGRALVPRPETDGLRATSAADPLTQRGPGARGFPGYGAPGLGTTWLSHAATRAGETTDFWIALRRRDDLAKTGGTTPKMGLASRGSARQPLASIQPEREATR